MAVGRAVALAAVFVIFSAASGSAQDAQDPYAPIDAQDNQDPYAPIDSDRNDFARNGFYVGLAVSLGIDTFDDDVEEDINDEVAARGLVDFGFTRVTDRLGVTSPAPVDFAGVQTDMKVDLSIGASGRIGYRFHPNFSAELQAEWQRGFDANIGVVPVLKIPEVLNPPNSRAPARDEDLKYVNFATVEVEEPWVITGNVKGYLLTGRWQPFLLAGVGLMTAKVTREVDDIVGQSQEGDSQLARDFRDSLVESDAFESGRFTGFAARFGGGVDIYATEDFAFTLGIDYVFPTGEVKAFSYVSVLWGVQYRF